VHFLLYQPHQSRLEAQRNVQDLDHQYFEQGAHCGGGSSVDRRRIIVMHGALLGCHCLAQCSRRSPGILELVIRDLCLVVHFLSTMQSVIGTQ
jgi:hypothetical protein